MPSLYLVLLMMESIAAPHSKSLRIAILATDGVDSDTLLAVRSALRDRGISSLIIGCRHGALRSAQGTHIEIDQMLADEDCAKYDGVFIPGGCGIDLLCEDKTTINFVLDSYKNGKIVASSVGGEKLVIKAAQTAKMPNGAFVGEGVISQSDNDSHFMKRFLVALTDIQSVKRPDIELMKI